MPLSIFEHFNLRNHNTFHCEVGCRYLVNIRDVNDLYELNRLSSFKSTPFMVLGGGSNVLFTEDFNGYILHNQLRGKTVIKQDADSVYLKAGAGENWHDFVLWTLEHGYYGLENLSLIPGTVGAAPIQNIGAYGVELKDVFVECEVFNFDLGVLQTITRDQAQFGYRDSIFKQVDKGLYCITSVVFRLSTKPHINIQYGDIEKYLIDQGVSQPYSPVDVSQAVIAIRQSKLPDPTQLGNAGSFFKNPLISLGHFNELQDLYPKMPHFRVSDDVVKVPAGWLIDQSGLKGTRVGDVGTYPHQALVIVNYGSAVGHEIVAFARFIIDTVYEKFNIKLVPEVNFIP